MKRSLILLAAMMFMAGASAQNLPGDVWKIVPATELGFNETKLKTGLEALSGNVAIVRRGFLSFKVCVYGNWTQAAALRHCQETLDAAWAQA